MYGHSRQEKLRRSGSPTLRVPIAIIGGACRFPGRVDSLDALWAALSDGRDLIEHARDRSDGAAPVGRLDGPFCFDPAAFQITPREAAEMDPQQQIFLQVAQEAFADAGYTRERLKGSRTGVVAGVYANDYLLMRAARPETIDTHTAAGISHAVIANRVSYVYDLAAPSYAVDSACSSGLLAVHLAVRMLRAGDADVCLAGAVSLIPSPLSQLITGRVLTMASDGRCKAFDASADGIVRSEGCGTLVLKRLDDALADGDPIRAVILGTASNQDGRTNGLSAPSGTAQQAVIRAALADAGLEADVVDFIEAHGTGTPLGDPVEISALGAVYGHSWKRPPLVGAVKANLGHTEAVSGIAGLMKAMMVVEHRQAPPQLYLRTVNVAVEEARKNLRLGAAACALETPNEAVHAGVSSFGFSGTNVHVVLRAALAEEIAPAEEPPPLGLALVVSAATPKALLQHQSDFAEFLARCSSDTEVERICRAAATRRDAQPYRLATTADSAHALVAEASRSRPVPAAAITGAPLVAFLFTGQTAQSTNMAAGLMQRDDEFRARIRELDAMFVRAGDPLGPFARMASIPDGVALPTEIAQGANFCLQITLAEWLLRANLQPAMVAGHSVGEIAAACVAGLLSIEDGVDVIRARARLMLRVEGAGRTIVVRGPIQRFLDASVNLANVDIAAENSPYSIAVACSTPDLPAVEQIAAIAGCSTAVLPTSVAFHSRIMDPLLREMQSELANLRPKAPRLDMISSVDPLAVPEADADYWARGLRQTVRFRGALETMFEMGVEAFVEVGPHPVLTVFAEETAQHSRRDLLAVSSLNRRAANGETLLAALGRLWERGVPVDWATVLGRPTGRQALPRCPGPDAAVHQRSVEPSNCGSDVALTAPAAELVSVSDESPFEDRVAHHVGAVMKENGPIKRGIALQAMGFDSLMAVELKKRLEAAFAISLPAKILLGSPTVRDVAMAVEASLDESHLDQLSDVEVGRLLVRMQEGD